MSREIIAIRLKTLVYSFEGANNVNLALSLRINPSRWYRILRGELDITFVEIVTIAKLTGNQSLIQELAELINKEVL